MLSPLSIHVIPTFRPFGSLYLIFLKISTNLVFSEYFYISQFLCWTSFKNLKIILLWALTMRVITHIRPFRSISIKASSHSRCNRHETTILMRLCANLSKFGFVATFIKFQRDHCPNMVWYFLKPIFTATDETSCDCLRWNTATEGTILATHESDETIH